MDLLQGINVRHKAASMKKILADSDQITALREKARANKNKYGGVSSEQVRSGGIQWRIF